VGQSSDDATDKVESKIARVSDRALDVVPEDPEIEHVAAQVHPSPMEEHRREEGGPVGEWNLRRQVSAGCVFPRYNTPGGDE
jgi:hypothetical protein